MRRAARRTSPAAPAACPLDHVCALSHRHTPLPAHTDLNTTITRDRPRIHIHQGAGITMRSIGRLVGLAAVGLLILVSS